MNILHVDSSILGSNSVSRSLSAAAVERLRTSASSVEVVYRDLSETPIPHLSPADLAVIKGGEAPEASDPNGQILEEFLAADLVVLGVAFYNFGIPSTLKAWIDRIAVAGKTFRYGSGGPEGLSGDKRVILAISRGGLYGPGTPSQSFEHAESYLRSVFAFLGVQNLEVVLAEGIGLGPEQREKSVTEALQQVAALKVA